ncbi:hypothetical protein CL634_00865 [bacterium]|nr:hypothetical protein [bacterium]
MNEIQTDHFLKTMLQRDVQFVVGNKVIKEGKIIVFNIKDFYISFILHTKKNQNKTYEIPLPFNIYQNDTTLFFDYTLDRVHRKSAVTKHLINCISKSIGKKSKLFDSMMTIRVNDGSNK